MAVDGEQPLSPVILEIKSLRCVCRKPKRFLFATNQAKFDPWYLFFSDVEGWQRDVKYPRPIHALSCGSISSMEFKRLEHFYETIFGVNGVEWHSVGSKVCF